MNEEDKKRAAIAFGEQFAKAAIPIACANWPDKCDETALERSEYLSEVINTAFLAGEIYTLQLFAQAEKAGIPVVQQGSQMQQGIIQVPRTNTIN